MRVTPNLVDNNSFYKPIDNYIYLYHTNTYIILPVYPEQINDSTNVTFSPTTALSRTAPIMSYSNSGPRTVQFSFPLHRDMVDEINYKQSNMVVNAGDDYVDTIIKNVQAIALPSYNASAKLVDPPLVAVKIGKEIFIKGVISGSIATNYSLPRLSNGKYAIVNLSFTITEVTPFDADTVMNVGSWREVDTSLERNLYKTSNKQFISNVNRK